MGDIVDLEAPVITITSPTNLSYVGGEFTITGTCTDNVKVTGIEVRSISQSNAGLTYDVSIKGEEWSAEVKLEAEGEYTFRIIASDRNRNTSVNSVKQITLLVDFDPPAFKNIEIDRGGGHTAPLLPMENLEALNASEYADIDYFQNESFKIKAEMAENMSIQQGATLELYDEEGNLFLSKLQTSSSLFTPEWEITANDINAAAAKKNITINPSEKRYFKVKITSMDDAGNLAQNEFWHLCWHPDADKPQISSTFENNGVIITAKESVIPMYVFDDDNLDKVYYKIYSESGWNALPGANDDDKLASLLAEGTAAASFTEYSASGRETTGMTVVSPPENGDFRIALLTKDKKMSGETVWSQRAFRLAVTSDTAPIIMVDEPVENETPVLRASETPSGALFLDIKGYSIDKGGTALVSLAYVPQGKSVTDAENALASPSWGGGGVPLWQALLSGEEEETIGGSLYKKRPFEIAVNVNDIDNAPRRFVLYAQNVSGGKTFKSFTILGNTQGPAVSIEYKDAAGDWQDMSDVHTHDKLRDLELRIKVSPTAPIAGIALTEGSGTRNIQLQDTESSTAKIAVDTAQTFANDHDGANRVYTFLVTDSLGNETRSQKTVVISTLPFLERITSDMSSRTFAAGETITLQAVFSAPVRASGAPRIKLFYDDSDSAPKYADYTKGGGSATLEFTFAVPENAQSSKLLTRGNDLLLLENGSSITPMDSGTPVRLPNIAEDKLLQHEKTFALDGVAPRIVSVSAGQSAEWNKQGSVIEISATVDKRLLVEGSPRLRLSTSGTPAVIEASFVRIAQIGTNAALVFNYKVDSAFTRTVSQPQDNYVTLSYDAILDADVVKDIVGNPLSTQFAAGELKTGGGSLIKIDTSAPAAPSLKVNGAIAAGGYAAAATFDVDGGESGATIQYTTTNGSLWTGYNAPFTVITTSGDIFARQIDKAGNVSANSNGSKVTVTNAAPLLAAITCDIPDGTYPQGETLTFKLIFTGGAVHTGGETKASITIEGGNAGDAKNVLVPVRSVTEDNADNILHFDYAIPSGVIMSPVKITAIDLTGVKSGGGMADPTYNASDMNKFGRPGLNILASVPKITSYAPLKDGILDADGKIRLTFDRAMWPESGTITIEPNYGADTWVAPPVLSNEAFEEVFNALDTTNKQYIMLTSTSIEPALDATTGKPLGPYLKTTHGLDMTQTYATPDLTTKYVLKFDANLTGTSDEAKNFRKAFKAAGYHKQVIDVTSSAVTGAGTTTIVITPETLPEGRNWQLYMDAGAFRDAAGNLSEAMAGSASTDSSDAAYAFWSNKVAAPVIRVNRVSTNNPTGAVKKTDARIDSETPGAAIVYGKSTPLTVTADKTAVYAYVQTEDNPDIAVSTLKAINPTTLYSSAISFSDDDLYTARKDYVAAIATKSNFTSSDAGYEGIFRSVIIYRLQTNADYFRLEGATIYGSSSHIAGFPLRVNDMTGKYILFAYTGTSQEIESKNYKDFIWVSYEIVSTWYQSGLTVSSTNTAPDNPGWETKKHFTRAYGTYGLNTAWEQTQQ
jgi:hypothetical protein